MSTIDGRAKILLRALSENALTRLNGNRKKVYLPADWEPPREDVQLVEHHITAAVVAATVVCEGE